MRKGLRQGLTVAGIIFSDICKMKYFNIGELFIRIWTISKNFESNLQRVLAGGLEEHTGEELRARLHLEPMHLVVKGDSLFGISLCFGIFGIFGISSVLEYFYLGLSYLSSSGMWIAIMETGSSLRSDHPRMSESLRAWFTLKEIMMMMIVMMMTMIMMIEGVVHLIRDNDDDDIIIQS